MGERKLFQILREQLSSDCIILFDLLLKANGTIIQIDCLIIFPESVYLIEVKNYRGDFYLKDDKWFAAGTKSEIRNPLLQLERTEFLFRCWMRDLRVNFPVKSYVVFVHDGFWLYGDSMKLPIVYRPQLRRFLQLLSRGTHGVQMNNRHRRVAEILLDHHLDDSTYVRLPDYKFEVLRKGLVCSQCDSHMELIGYKRVISTHCSDKESVESVVMRLAVEFSLLFPDENVTVRKIHEWCGGKVSRRNLTRILSKYMIIKGKSRQTHYVFATPNIK